MSGHSKWSTIKRQKETQDQKRGAVFTKLSRAIAVAVKEGGSPDPEMNFALRLVIDKAKAANMPKENIRKAIERASGKGEGNDQNLREIMYEGFGPRNVGIITEVLTDNTNRTVAEIKKIFETRGGSLASPGSVSYMFQKMGLILVKKNRVEEQMLSLIDLGAEEVEEVEDGIEVYTQPEQLIRLKENLVKAGFKVKSMEFVMSPKVTVTVNDKKDSEKIVALMEALNAHPDVQKTWANFDVVTREKTF